MVHFINEKCIKCKYTDCVEVCPVDCFHEGDDMLVIDPDVCIDCGVCVPECPVDAISSDDSFVDGKSVEDVLAAVDVSSLTDAQKQVRHLCNINDHYSKLWPVIVDKKDELPSADDFKDVSDKFKYIYDYKTDKT